MEKKSNHLRPIYHVTLLTLKYFKQDAWNQVTVCTSLGSSQIDIWRQVQLQHLLQLPTSRKHWTYRITNQVWSWRRCLHVGIFDEEHGNGVFGKLILRGCKVQTALQSNKIPSQVVEGSIISIGLCQTNLGVYDVIYGIKMSNNTKLHVIVPVTVSVLNHNSQHMPLNCG